MGCTNPGYAWMPSMSGRATFPELASSSARRGRARARQRGHMRAVLQQSIGWPGTLTSSSDQLSSSCGGFARSTTGRSSGICGHACRAPFKLLLADVPALELLAFAATKLANADVPADIASGPPHAALRKPDGGACCIATGDIFRRLVSRALAKTWDNVGTQRMCAWSSNGGTTQSFCVARWAQQRL